MAHQKGSTTTIMIGFENVAFNTVATAGFVLPINYGEALVGEQSINIANTIRGNRNPTQGYRGIRQVSGPVPVPVDSVCLPYWLTACYGDPTTTGTDPYTHEWKIASTMPSISIEKAFTDLTTDRYYRFTGCKLDGFTLSVGGDGELIKTFNVFGAQDSFETSAFDAAPTTPTLSRINMYDGAVEEGGASSSIISSVEINVNFNLDKREELVLIGDAGIRSSLPAGIVDIDGSVTAIFDDDGYTLLNKGIAGTESSLKLTFTRSASSVYEIEFQELEYGRTGPPVEQPGGLLVTLPFTAHYGDGSEASAVVERITNSTASYDLIT